MKPTGTSGLLASYESESIHDSDRVDSSDYADNLSRADDSVRNDQDAGQSSAFRGLHPLVINHCAVCDTDCVWQTHHSVGPQPVCAWTQCHSTCTNMLPATN